MGVGGRGCRDIRQGRDEFQLIMKGGRCVKIEERSVRRGKVTGGEGEDGLGVIAVRGGWVRTGDG